MIITDFIPEFLLKGLITVLLVVFITAPLGCLILWKRMSFLGDSLGHAAFCGISLALIFGFFIPLSVVLFALVFLLVHHFIQKQILLKSEALLAILSLGSLSLGSFILTYYPKPFDINAIFFGDLLTVRWNEILLMVIFCGFVWGFCYKNWNNLVFESMDGDLAYVAGVNIAFQNKIVLILLASTIALSLQMMGVLLVSGMLIIPSTTASLISTSPESMVLKTILLGLISAVGGFFLSYYLDSPSGVTIVLVALGLFLGVCVYGKKTSF